jgi:hypothetical protein
MPAFAQTGATVNVAVTGSAQNLTFTAPATNTSPVLRLCNIGTQTVFINFQATATVSNGIPLLANSAETFEQGSTTTLSVIAATTGSTLYATTGFGE